MTDSICFVSDSFEKDEEEWFADDDSSEEDVKEDEEREREGGKEEIKVYIEACCSSVTVSELLTSTKKSIN